MTKAVLAVDPGGTTGWASGYYKGVYPEFHSGEVRDWMEWCARVHSILMAGDFDWTVVVERYTVTSETAKKTRQYDALEIIGVLRYLCHLTETPFVMQTPAEAKAFATDRKLHHMGWFTRGRGHANDAARHLLVYTAKAGLIDPRRLIPEEGK